VSTPNRRRSFHEAAHKAPDAKNGSNGAVSKPGRRQNYNMAAHKLGYWPVAPAPVRNANSEEVRAKAEQERDIVAQAGRLVLALGALGVVFGDLGTSPLYTEHVIFSLHGAAARVTPGDVYGITSLIFWALTIIVSLKYAVLLMRAHNRGDGGIMALSALIQRRRVGRTALLVTLGIFGAGLFFGDGMITPAISVTSAVEGLNVAAPGLSHLVIPISLGLLAGLFLIQRRGTGAVGWLFGPVLLVWFAAIGILGAREVVAHPGVIQALSPTWAARFLATHGFAAFLTLGGVVLAVTGAEALYADRGHFGASPIRMTWFGIVMPAVVLSYLGQSALILAHPHAVSNPFYLLVPSGGRVAMVFLATAATIIASQAALTGSFSIARQAVQLGFLPRLKIRHTSEFEGQIYVPIINWTLGLGVGALVLIFQHSVRLAAIYGVAVTGTFVLDTILFLAVARSLWRTAIWKLAILGAVLLTVEVTFFSSNLSKIDRGAWLPLCVGLLTALLMVTWRKGATIVTRNRNKEEGSLDDFLYGLRMADPPLHRVPRVGVYLSPGKSTTPLALRADVEHYHVLHDKVLIVSIDSLGVPHVEVPDRFAVEVLGSGLYKVIHVTIHAGYQDRTNVPEALALARKRGLLERALDLEHASYFVSRITIMPCDQPSMSRWRKLLFTTMARNAASPIEAFGLSPERTVMVGSQISI
jgi:KUP system potassium uptake protein